MGNKMEQECLIELFDTFGIEEESEEYLCVMFGREFMCSESKIGFKSSHLLDHPWYVHCDSKNNIPYPSHDLTKDEVIELRDFLNRYLERIGDE